MVVVETEGSYTNQITVDTLDVHVGQSYSVLVTADQIEADYYIVASPKLQPSSDSSSLVGVGVLVYTIPIPIHKLAGLCQSGLIHLISVFQWFKLNPLGNELFIYSTPRPKPKKNI